MKYANIKTHELADSLAASIQTATTFTTNATINEWSPLGWREVTQVDQPPKGYKATQYQAKELSKTTCRLTIVSMEKEL